MSDALKGRINVLKDFIQNEAVSFGAKDDDYVSRNNTGDEALKKGGAFFGFINKGEESSGPYNDFSFVIFPSEKEWLVCLGVGSEGFKNDFELATRPGLRRSFSKLVDYKSGFCKSDFSDIETGLPKFKEQVPNLKETIKTYEKVLPACQIINFENEDEGNAKKYISAFLAAYAKLRNWPNNQKQRDAVNDALNSIIKNNNVNVNNEEEEVKKLIEERKFLIIQGAPGTGKTRLAKKIAKNLSSDSDIFFTQFHAETSFSDFIYGIQPNIQANSLAYIGKEGIFTTALKKAKENSEKKVVLIIDEINRANLSNVLGPIFYLFEYKQDDSDIEIEISPGLEIKKIPENLYVIGTMNTADRSLAVVDFALRRRFAWYTLKPKSISNSNGRFHFHENDFLVIHNIFDWYAKSEELVLEPGQGYFITAGNDDEEIKKRIKYEIYPLIKEYLQEGLLTSAKEEFNNYFMERINSPIYE